MAILLRHEMPSDCGVVGLQHCQSDDAIATTSHTGTVAAPHG